jgi:hypothetical protein
MNQGKVAAGFAAGGHYDPGHTPFSASWAINLERLIGSVSSIRRV